MRNSYFYVYNILSELHFITFIFMIFLLANVFAQPPGAGNSLNFDGWDGTYGEYLNMGQNSNLQIDDMMTFEAWVYIDGVPGSGEVYNVVACGANGDGSAVNHLYGLEIDYEKVAYYYHEYGSGQDIYLPASIAMWSGQWVHLAFSRYSMTYDPHVLITYDGMREGPEPFHTDQKPTGGNQTIFVLGGGFGDTGSGTIPIESKYFNGRMDEVRVWDTKIEFTLIREWMNKRVNFDHPSYDNLVAYWRLDESLVSDGAEDLKGDNDGTLMNMEDTDRILSTAPIGDASLFAVRSDLTDPETYANITGTSDVPIDVEFPLDDEDDDHPGFYSPLAAIQVNAAPNNPPDPEDYSSPNTYWELWSRDGQFDGDFTATVKFHYDYIAGIRNEGTYLEPLLNLFRRNDPNSGWSSISATLNNEDDPSDGEGYFEITIDQDSYGDLGFRGQYIITSDPNDNPLPVELATFTAHLVDEGVKLEWVTHGEVNNLGFELWRAMDKNEKYQMISSYQNNRRLIGAGNSNTTRYYQYIDKKVQEGHDYYYQLWDVSYSGERNSYGPIFLSINRAGHFPENYTLYQNYPNPFNPLTYIRFQIHQMNFHGDKLIPVNLDIYDLLGKKIKSLMNSDLHIGDYTYSWDGTNDLGYRVASGTYVYILRLGDQVVSKKLVLIR